MTREEVAAKGASAQPISIMAYCITYQQAKILQEYNHRRNDSRLAKLISAMASWKGLDAKQEQATYM